ncbi:MAG: zinc-ribbon domain-containing protein [Bacteroidales bacterium]|nr:zinc-ribbon domain-containing protein [Bacteroidales bacterium]
MKCLKCNAEIADNAKFCPICGAKVEIENKCPNCGATVEKNAKFCVKCGTKIDVNNAPKLEVQATNEVNNNKQQQSTQIVSSTSTLPKSARKSSKTTRTILIVLSITLIVLSVATIIVTEIFFGTNQEYANLDIKSHTDQDTNHEYVDLGLPSGTKWATCNVGANAPEEYGDYFAWGETSPKETYDQNSYKYCNGHMSETLTKYCNYPGCGYNGFTDNLTTLEASDDAATVSWGKDWRIPTNEEMTELIDNCSYKWTEQNGIKGLVAIGPNGNSIFFPATGYRYGNDCYGNGDVGEYWTSSIISMASYSAYTHRVYPNGFDMDEGYIDDDSRECGRTIRPVISK